MIARLPLSLSQHAARALVLAGCTAISTLATTAVPEPGSEPIPHAKPLLQVGAMVQAQVDFGDAEEVRPGRSYLRRARVSAAGAWRRWSYGAEVDLADQAPGEASSQRARFGEVVLTWAPNDLLELKLGRMDPAFGLETLIGDEDLQTIEPARASQAFGPGWHSALALQSPLPRGSRATLTLGRDEAGRSVSSARLEAPWFAPGLAPADLEAKLGLDAFVARGSGHADESASAPREAAGLDVQVGHGRWSLAAEWLAGRLGPARTFAHGSYVTLGAWILPGRMQVVMRRDAFRERGAASSPSTWLAGVNLFAGNGRTKLMINHLRSEDARLPSVTSVRWQAAF